MDPRTADFSEIQQEIRNHDGRYQGVFVALRESYASGELRADDFQNLVSSYWRGRMDLIGQYATTIRRRASIQWKSKQQESNLAGEGSSASGRQRPQMRSKSDEQEPNPADEDATISGRRALNDRPTSPNNPGAVAELLTAILDAQMEQWERDDGWERGLRYHYNCDDPELPDMVWCPILREYDHADSRTAGHIIPPSIGYANAGFAFGEPDNGAEDIWSMTNGVIMASHLKKQFNQGNIVLVPVPGHDGGGGGGPCGWQVVLLDLALKRNPDYARLDRRELEFKNKNRPEKRFLFLHFVLSVLSRYARSQSWMDLSAVVCWTVPGAFLRRNLFGALAERAMDGYDDMVALVFQAGLFDPEKDTPAEEVTLAAGLILAEWDRRRLEGD